MLPWQSEHAAIYAWTIMWLNEIETIEIVCHSIVTKQVLAFFFAFFVQWFTAARDNKFVPIQQSSTTSNDAKKKTILFCYDSPAHACQLAGEQCAHESIPPTIETCLHAGHNDCARYHETKCTTQ